MSRLQRTKQNQKRARKKMTLLLLSCLTLLGAGIATYAFMGSSSPAPKADNSKIKKDDTPSSASSIPATSMTETSTPPNETEPNWETVSRDNPLPILMWHNVDANVLDNNYMTPETCESDFKMLAENGYYTVTPTEAYRILTEHVRPQEKMVWLRFDDSCANFYTNVFPLLKKYNLKATSFVITGKIGTPNFLTNEQMLEMKESGLVSFESHTVNHLSLETMTAAEQQNELVESKQYLDELLHQDTTVLCYPSGAFNNETATVAANAGYKLGLTTKFGYAEQTDGLFTLPQIRMGSTMDGGALLATLEQMSNYLN